MKAIAVAMSIFTAASAHAQSSDCTDFPDPRYVYSAKVERVYDGDTIFMDIDLGFRTWLHDEPLRLWGVDTPEVRGDGKAEGLAVRDLVSTWVPVGTEVLIRTLKGADGADRTGSFHRYLVVVCPDGWTESVNARLIREGHAELYADSEAEELEVREAFGMLKDELSISD